VIDIIKEKEGCSKHEAILKAKQLAGELPAAKPQPPKSANRELADDAARAAVLSKVWSTMKAGMALSTVARRYLEGRGLDYKLLEKAGAAVGYNSGQMHYGERRDEALMQSCLKYGLLSDSGRKSRTGETAYTTFAKGAVAFSLKTEGGQLGGLYFRSVDDRGGRHYYLRDRRGLWPKWPAMTTRRVLLCESVIDAASVVQHAGEVLGESKSWATLALYGTNGWTREHTEAIGKLEQLEEVCLMLDGDAAGRRATDTYAGRVRELWPAVQVTSVELPDGQDVNGMLVEGGPEALAKAVADRCEVVKSQDVKIESIKAEAAVFTSTETLRTEAAASETKEPKPETKQAAAAMLDESNPYDLGYGGHAARYRIKGYRLGQLDSLKVTLQIVRPQTTSA